jgi:hypothetical protein
MALTQFDKAIVAFIGMALMILNSLAGQQLFSPDVQGYVNLGIAVLTPISVYAKANKPA